MLCDSGFSGKLTGWFAENRRYMPWREDPTPYHVWVSEIMLQQTRVDTVLPYYFRFMEALPDLKSLAECEEERLLKLWEGLGYYSRVRNLQKAAITVLAEYGGNLPKDPAALQKLPGIGSYTAGAILSIAFGLPEPVVDGNVLRVIMRVNGCYDDIKAPETKKKLENELREFLLKEGCDPSAFNQGLMELGALICVPNGKPLCASCPVKAACEAQKMGLTEVLPVTGARESHKNAQITVLILKDGKTIGIRKNSEKGLLSGLYGLPRLEGHLSPDEIIKLLSEAGYQPGSVKPLPSAKHVFTHITWEMNAYLVELEGPAPDAAKTDIFNGPTDKSAGRNPEGGETGDKDTWNRENAELTDLRFVDVETLERDIPLPQAFRKWDFSKII